MPEREESEREEARRVVVEVTASEEGEERREARGRGRSVSDAEELKAILEAVGEFLSKIQRPIKELVETLISAMDGAKLGEDVAKFYQQLKSSGLPDELAVEMTKQYFRERLEAVNVMGLLSKFVKKEIIGEKEEGEG